MICKKCGATIDERSKFCIYCGNKINVVEIPNAVENNMNVSNKQNEFVIEEVKSNNNLVNNTNLDTTKNQVDQVNYDSVNSQLEKTVVVPIQQVNQQMSIQNPPKKSNKTWIFIILGIVLAIITGILLFLSINKSSNNSIKVLQKAINNFAVKGENSGTINLDLLLGSNESDSINISATMKYARVDYNYNIALTLNKSLLFDEVNLYSTITEKDVTLYAKSSLVDMLGVTSSNTDMWVHYVLGLDELIDTEEQNIELKSNIDLSSIFDDNHYKYVGKKDSLRQYQLIIDNELISKVKKIVESEDSLKESLTEIPEEQINLEKPIYLDFYINKSNELAKITMDISELIEEEENLSKAIIEISFLNFGNTMVDIPKEAKNSNMDIITYFSTYMKKENMQNNIN